MSLTTSEDISLKTMAPDFELLDTKTKQFLKLSKLKSFKATVIMFICNHCPYVKHIQNDLVTVANIYQEKGINFIAISTNDPDEYLEDAPEMMKEIAEKLKYPFPFLFDEMQTTAKAYHAVCTPEFFVFDKDLLLVYHGRFDDSSPSKKVPVTGKDLKAVLDYILIGKPITSKQYPSIGCSIKWKENK
ncbi:MAG: thioredoxin family protein [Oligoflexia bacterium]|nr:thioredoxin family protein [Oligoflexia bacterium]